MPVKTFRLKKDILYIKPELADSFQDEFLVESIRKQILEKNTKNLVLDLSDFSLFLAVRIGALVSVYHFTDFQSGKLFIIVNNMQAKKFIQTLSFGTTTVIYNHEKMILEKIA